MPTPQDVLQSLESISRQGMILAVMWHIYIAVLLLSPRLSRRSLALALTLPIASVSLLAWIYGNPFNGTAFAVLAGGLGWMASRMPEERRRLAPWPIRLVAIALIGFAWVYPHFLPEGSAALYLVAAPLGLIPCPTLSMLLGVSMFFDGFPTRAWGNLLGGFGLFYGLFGAMRLGVAIDWVLALGALVLLASVWLTRGHAALQGVTPSPR